MARTTGNAKDLITFTRASTGTFLGSNGLLQTAAINTPRVEYDANGVAKGLLIEEARTNLIANSENVTAQSHGVTNATIQTNVAISPDGTQNALALIEDNTYSEHRIRITASIVSGTTYTASVFVKANGRNFVWLNSAITGGAWFNLATGEVALETGTGTGSIESAGNGWWKISATATAASTTTTSYAYWLQSGEAAVQGNQGDGVSGFYFWGPQLEAGSFPTSYIPTSGATATRSADLASVSVSEFGYNQAQGSVVVEMDYAGLGYGETNYNSVYIVCGTNLQRLLYNPQQIAVWDGSGAGAIANANYATNVVYKAASTWGSGSMGVSTNGSTPVFDNAYDGSFASITDFNLFRGNFLEGGGITGHLKSINYYPLRLSDAKLQSLTS